MKKVPKFQENLVFACHDLNRLSHEICNLFLQTNLAILIVDFFAMKSKHGENALFEAVSHKRKDIVDLLLEHGKNPSSLRL